MTGGDPSSPVDHVPRPNLFLAGAPRCGTTTLYGWLAAHPHVFMTPRKEQWYFSRDIRAGMALGSERDYLSQFAGAGPEHRWVGEGSTVYLFSRVAMAEIAWFNPDARIVIAVRNPLEMVASYHAHLVATGREPERSLERAWSLQGVRARGEQVPDTIADARLLQYREVARLGEQVQRALDVFPREQVHVLVFDDLRNRSERVRAELFGFLDVDDIPDLDLTARNPRRAVRSSAVARGVRRYQRPLRNVHRLVRRVLPGLPALGAVVTRANTRPAKPEVLTGEFRLRLCEEFREDVALLSELIGRDLRGWVK